jgi:hypothetical protein
MNMSLDARPDNVTLDAIWTVLTQLKTELEDWRKESASIKAVETSIPLDLKTATAEMATIRRTVEALPQYDGCYDTESTLREAARHTTDKAKIAEYEHMLYILPSLNGFFAGLNEVRTFRTMRDEWGEPVYG